MPQGISRDQLIPQRRKSIEASTAAIRHLLAAKTFTSMRVWPAYFYIWCWLLTSLLLAVWQELEILVNRLCLATGMYVSEAPNSLMTDRSVGDRGKVEP